MKVLFDTQIFDWQINGGISRYFTELFHRFDKSGDIDLLFKCYHSYNTYIQNSPWLSRKKILADTDFKGKLRLVKKFNEFMNRRYSNAILKAGKQDIFHPTYYDTYFLKRLGQKPFVLTVYDLTHEKFFARNAAVEKTLAQKKLLIEKAAHIVSISENTKNDVVNYYHIAPEKITTVYLASSFGESSSTVSEEEKDTLPADYILFVGSRKEVYKNFIPFVREAAPVIRKLNIHLIVAGGGGLNATETALLKELDIDKQTISFAHVSDAFLKHLYKQAMVFIFPSLYEGFGIPVLEAMQCRCPALLSNNSSLPEVGGNAAVYFDPFKAGDLGGELEKLLLDEAGREQMIAAGTEQATKFNWDITAEQHIQVYKKLC
ncbi:MAG: glycosyltransferase family 4 protein [Chitinophagaceae bacterium]|nr:glycosyltransferase family 4 protein [Chitinophagaceae bacterium]